PVEFVDVRGDDVAAELGGGVGVDRQVLLRLLRADGGAPHPGPREEEALQPGELTFRERGLRAFRLEGQYRGGFEAHAEVLEVLPVGDHRYAESAEVADVLAQGEFAVDTLGFDVGVAEHGGDEAVELG